MADWFPDAMKVVSGAIAGSGGLFIFEKLKLKRQATNLAIDLVGIFQRYAIACNDCLTTKTPYNIPEGPFDSRAVSAIPDLEKLPDDIDGWRAFKVSLSNEARMFDTLINQANSKAHWAAEYGDADETQDTVDREAVKLGRKAQAIAVDIALEYGIELAKVEWNVLDTFDLADKNHKVRDFLDEQFRESLLQNEVDDDAKKEAE